MFEDIAVPTVMWHGGRIIARCFIMIVHLLDADGTQVPGQWLPKTTLDIMLLPTQTFDALSCLVLLQTTGLVLT